MAEAKGFDVRLAQPGPIPLEATLQCAPGEVLALVGPSGSGKSTILRCIAGLYRTGSGRIRCDGELWFDAACGINMPPHRRAVGYVFQSYALFPHMTVLGNILAALGHRPRAERRARASALLERVHLAGFESRRPSALSGGEQQRIALARALARDPKVLLLDEPFSALDQVMRRKLYEELLELLEPLGIPVVLVTHDLDEAVLLADRICILHHGKTLQTGPPFEVLSRPASALVARLVDLKNLFEAIVIEHQARLTLIAWRNYRLEAQLNTAFAPGERIFWVIPEANVLLHRRDRPSRGERENPVRGVVSRSLKLGEHTHITIQVDGQPDFPLFMVVPTHIAHRNGIAVGVPVTVSLLAEGIHLMPWQDLNQPSSSALSQLAPLEVPGIV